MSCRAKLSNEFIAKLRQFIITNTTVNKCIENIKEALNDNSCQKCEDELGNTSVLKCGHIFCIDCTYSMLNEKCSICK